MSSRDELEQYEQVEARDILRLFEAARPAHVTHAPADFRLKVLQKVSAQRERPRSFDWVRGWMTPALVPALTALLVLSLGANAWLARRSSGAGQLSASVEETTRQQAGLSKIQAPVAAAVFQAGLVERSDLGELVAAQSALKEQMVAFGFASQPAPAKSYFLGALYAEALAYTRSGDAATASQRWATIRQAVEPVASPLALYAGQMELLLTQSEAGIAPETADLMALFEPLYETYTGAHTDPMVPLFRAGTWLTNMRLAAASGDKAALRTPATIRYFKGEMVRLEAPKGVLDALDGMGRLVEQDNLSDRDVKGLLRLVKKMQRSLG